MKKQLYIVTTLLLILLVVVGCSAADPAYTKAALEENSEVIIKGYNGADYEVVDLDSSTHAITTIEYEHRAIHAGEMYTILDVVDLGNGAVRDFLIVTPNTTKWAHLVWEVEHELEATIQFYNNTTYSNNGTVIQSFNRNGNSTNNSTTLVYHTPTVVNVGTLVGTIRQGSGKKAGGADRQSNEFVLKQNSTYLARVTNNTANDNLVFTKFNWYELVNKD